VRTIAVVTVGRSDYGIYQPVLRRIEREPGLALQLLVGGMHLSPRHGMTVEAIEHDGFDVAARIDAGIESDEPLEVARAMGRGTAGFAEVLHRLQPDLLLVLGDRFEMHAAAIASTPLRIPMAHVHGGELSQGAVDDQLRHSITKLSHLHFVATERYRQRVQQLGEEPWRVTVSGAPALDHLGATEVLTRRDLEHRLGMSLRRAPLLCTFHPETVLGTAAVVEQVMQLLTALDEIRRPVVFTGANADPGGSAIIEALEYASEGRDDRVYFTSLGTQAYFSLMGHAAAMVGNSSSGIIEAASFGLPVVNVGARQEGRERGANVLDVAPDRAAIVGGLELVLDPEFRRTFKGMDNPYGDGDAARRIIDVLRDIPLDDRLLHKRFVDMEG
jgi:UDP-hydrolysing UDP-N-acetyl-D-glucosamine 2-epimerase